MYPQKQPRTNEPLRLLLIFLSPYSLKSDDQNRVYGPRRRPTICLSQGNPHLGPRATSARDQPNRGLPRLRNVRSPLARSPSPTDLGQCSRPCLQPPCSSTRSPSALCLAPTRSPVQPPCNPARSSSHNRRAVQWVRSSFALSTLAVVQSGQCTTDPAPIGYAMSDVRHRDHCLPWHTSTLSAPALRIESSRLLLLRRSHSGRRKHGRRRQGLADVLGLLDVLCMVILFHV